jgi:LCP family protein required for cell wall assembly
LVPFLVVVAITTAASTAGILAAASTTLDRVERIEGLESALSDPVGDIELYLVVGSDSRAGADPTAPDFGGIGTEADVSGQRSDTLMVLRHDLDTDELALLSIPRDLWVEIPGRGYDRVNSAYRDGAATVIETIDRNLGLPIHHYLEVDFNGFKAIVDAIGGVEMCFDVPTRDLNTGLNIVAPGCVVLDGVQALAYARSRYYEELRDGEWQRDGTADLGRIARQQRFVERALSGAVAAVLADPFRVGDVALAATDAVLVDAELDLVEAASLARLGGRSGLATYSLPVRGETIDDKAVLLLTDAADDMLAYFRGDGPPPPVG